MGVLARIVGERNIVFVYPDRHTEFGTGALGEAEMIEVGVGEHYRLDVREPASEASNSLDQRRP